ncbi:MAG: tyrosine-type recombinase/integrase, partial [Proteobacteria bacterium]|nr:tyrosine-type recombinase/integrase [Pseudomonadota bacterium]
MKLFPEKFAAHLQAGNLASIYLLAGDEPLQVGEAADAVRDVARRNGYASREVFFVERGFDWQALRSAGESLSLFAEKRVLELRLPTGKPGDVGAKMLVEFAERPPEDTILLVTSGKVDKKNKWVGALEKAGVDRRVRIHDLRHTCASWLIKQGFGPVHVAAYLGHANPTTTMSTYAHLFADDMADMGSALDSMW